MMSKLVDIPCIKTMDQAGIAALNTLADMLVEAVLSSKDDAHAWDAVVISTYAAYLYHAARHPDDWKDSLPELLGDIDRVVTKMKRLRGDADGDGA